MKKILILLFLISTSILAEKVNSQKHILVLHSYNKSMSWITNIDKAIVDILKPSQNNYILHTEYMDTKRIFTPQYLEYLKQLYKFKYKNVKLDLILASDNNAFDFLRKNRDELFGNVPTSFSGVNFFKDSDLKGYTNYTGAAEFFDAKQTVQSALLLYPKAKKILVINDYLTTGRAWEKTIKIQLKGIKKEITYSSNQTIEELQDTLKSLSKDTIVLLGVYFKDKDGKFFTYEKIGEMIATASSVPVFCLLEFNLKKGVVGGSVIGGYYQGLAMSKLAKKILNGIPVSKLPVVKQGATKFIFDYNGLKKYNMNISNLPPDTILLNKPISYYETHKNSILLTLVVVVILLIIIRILISRIKKQKIIFETMYNGTKDAIAILDMESKFLKVNPAYLEMTGFTREELLNTSCIALTVKEDIESSKNAIKEVLEVGYIKNFEKDCIAKDNKIISTNMSMSLMLSPNRILISVRDVSDLKEKEKQLIIAKQKAQQSSRLKSEFLANMSHEIRTPMNGILGMSHLILQTDLSNKQKKYLSSIDSSAKNLLNIINDILDFSKIEAGKLEIHKINFNIKELLLHIKNIVMIKADEKGLSFDINCDCLGSHIYFGDDLRISQVLLNLIGNAIKFTKVGNINIQIKELSNNQMRFIVSDTGIGLSKEQINKLFQSFTQADGSTTRKYGGTGLGLSISKQLVELMDGKIWIESEENIGSKFIFDIELEKGNIAKIIKKENIDISQLAILKGSKILLVEDNLINQEIVSGLLETSGINIDIASNGQEAVDVFNKNKYELILMDLQMPIMGGIEATKIIREINTKIPIIALTANAMKEDIEETKLAGMNEHLNKPIDVEILYETLLKYISKKVDSTEQTNEYLDDIIIPEFKSIDTKMGLSHMGNNKKLYLKILHDFYINNKALKLEELNNIELERSVHTIKGLSANIGALDLSKIAKEIEETLDKKLFNKFYEELNKVLNELSPVGLIPCGKDLTQESQKKNLLELSDTKRDELFNSLKEFANKRRAKGCRDTIEELDKYNLDSEDKKLLEQSKEFFKKREYHQILELI